MAAADRATRSGLDTTRWSWATPRRGWGTVLFDNLRNAMFETVGGTRRGGWRRTCFAHLHRLSLRFHLERRTGALTKVVERGTKSIDTMLYFLLFNIAPTIIELARGLRHLLRRCSALGWSSRRLVMVAVYIAFTRRVTDWRIEAARAR